MRVAVRDVFGGKQPACIAQGVDDDGRGLPDMLATKQREIRGVRTVALHRVQDVVIGHAVRHAAVEVFHAIGGRGVNQSGSVVRRGVVGQVHGRESVKALVHLA